MGRANISLAVTSRKLTAPMDRGHPGPEWVLWAVCGSLSSGEAGLRGRPAHAAAPGQVSFSNRTRSSKPDYGVPEHFILLTFGIAKLPFAAHECPCFPKCRPVLCSWDFLPREGVIPWTEESSGVQSMGSQRVGHG